MKYIAFACWFFFLLNKTYGQETRNLSLEEAFRFALANRQEIKAQALQVQIAESSDDKIRAQWKPSLSASADLRWNTQLQSNVLPIGAFGIPGVAPDATRTVRFGTPFSNTLSLQAEQKIYDANRNIDRRINSNETDIQRNELRRRESDLRYELAAAYYNALWQQERVRLSMQAVNRVQVLLNEGKVRFQNGDLLQNDLDRLLLDENNARFILNKAESDLALAWKNLNYLMRAPDGTAWVLSDNLEQLWSQSASAFPFPRLENHPEIRAEQLDAQKHELQGQKQLAQLRPAVEAYGNYTLLQLHDQPNPFAPDTWFPFNYIGIRATVPIYDGRITRLEARDHTLRSEISRLNAEQLEADFAYQTAQYRAALQQAELEMEQARRNLQFAKQMYDSDALRFMQGVILISALRDSAFAGQQAENNYLSATYNWLTTVLNYRKAAGGW